MLLASGVGSHEEGPRNAGTRRALCYHRPLMPALVRVQSLHVHFPVHAGFFRRKVDEIRAVHDVSFEIEEGTTLGLVGESGSGKSTVARTLLKLSPATGGEVFYRDQEILSLNEARFRPLRKEL